MSPTDPWTKPGCVFCTPEKLPPFDTYSGIDGYGLFRVFEPLAPVTPGHLLVVPVHHTTDAVAHPSITAGAMYVAAGIAGKYQEANIITSIGYAATQSVMHLHLHVVPRRPGDGLHLPWTGQHETQHPSNAHGTGTSSTEGAQRP